MRLVITTEKKNNKQTQNKTKQILPLPLPQETNINKTKQNKQINKQTINKCRPLAIW